MSRDWREDWRRLRGRRWVRWSAAALLAALAGNLVFALATARHGGWPPPVRPAAGFLILAAALALVPWFTNAARLFIWARFLGGTPGPGDAFRMSVAGDLAAAVTPTAAGAGTVRLAMLLGHDLSMARASTVLALMAAEDALFFAVALPVIFLRGGFGGGPAEAALARVGLRAAWVLAGGLLLGVLLGVLWERRAGSPGAGGGRFARFVSGVREVRGLLGDVLRRGKLRAAGCLVLTAVQWTARYTVVAAVLAAFGVFTAPWQHVLLQWVVFTAGTVVPTPGGSAAIEAAFALVYQPLVPAALLGSVTAVWRLVLFYFVLILDAVVLAGFLLRRPFRPWSPRQPRLARSRDPLARPFRPAIPRQRSPERSPGSF